MSRWIAPVYHSCWEYFKCVCPILNLFTSRKVKISVDFWYGTTPCYRVIGKFRALKSNDNPLFAIFIPHKIAMCSRMCITVQTSKGEKVTEIDFKTYKYFNIDDMILAKMNKDGTCEIHNEYFSTKSAKPSGVVNGRVVYCER